MNSICAPIPFPPGNAALESHCRRVAGLCKLIAHQLFLSTEDKERLHLACLLHHQTEEAVATHGSRIPEGVRAVMESFWHVDKGDPQERVLAAVLRLADAFDGAVQKNPHPHVEVKRLLAELRTGIGTGLWSRKIVEAFQECTKPVQMPPPQQWRVPVFPQAAVRTLEAIRSPSVSLPQVVDAARRDPATAGCIMHLANSALYSERGEVSTLQMAVARIGFVIACKVVATLAMRPLLSIPKLEGLWPHSIEVADLAEQLAERSGAIDPGEAYLAGLLHDVGRIALGATTLYDAARLQGLEESGCPTVYAEDLILHTNHGALGAQIALTWKLPGRLVAAIEHHHRPEVSSEVLPSLLYLAEYQTGSVEDLTSNARLRLALSTTGLTERDLEGCQRSGVGTWLAAA
ncbi:MAG TPA: HDOD domain-containing protein [Verrucomicrobiae bacterium]|nr:HDOD domain-containing protein [Verrucomicrobiae bacterium]